jgi:hypothetical protein
MPSIMATTNNQQQFQPLVAATISVLVPTDTGQPQKAEHLNIVIDGEPQVQERKKMSSLGRMHLYDPSSKSKAKFRSAVLTSLRSLKFKEPPLFLKVDLKVTAVFHIGNWAKDVDNLLKFILDAPVAAYRREAILRVYKYLFSTIAEPFKTACHKN